ncbi:hypothetical protein HBB16_21800 [Pseudonocardia sp. MCCB 268]|nr:hypothetical protein [Pseudonocardia cytotoxica]
MWFLFLAGPATLTGLLVLTSPPRTPCAGHGQPDLVPQDTTGRRLDPQPHLLGRRDRAAHAGDALRRRDHHLQNATVISGAAARVRHRPGDVRSVPGAAPGTALPESRRSSLPAPLSGRSRDYLAWRR